MTLHNAITQVLKKSKKPLRASEIAEVLNKNSWYTKKDGSAIESGQFSLRVKNYAHYISHLDLD